MLNSVKKKKKKKPNFLSAFSSLSDSPLPEEFLSHRIWQEPLRDNLISLILLMGGRERNLERENDFLRLGMSALFFSPLWSHLHQPLLILTPR